MHPLQRNPLNLEVIHGGFTRLVFQLIPSALECYALAAGVVLAPFKVKTLFMQDICVTEANAIFS